MSDPDKSKKVKIRYYRKRVELFRLLEKIKMWPSRKGVLHGIMSIEIKGNSAVITTHCHKKFHVTNSRNSRAARWLRNKWYHSTCKVCAVPQWKVDKYLATRFKRHYGSSLEQSDQ